MDMDISIEEAPPSASPIPSNIPSSPPPIPPLSPLPPPPSQTGQPLTSFTLFPKLIIELRLKVWDFCFALQPARLVEVRTAPHDCDAHRGFCPRFAACRTPVLVRVCSEARMVAREQAARAGHLCFGTLTSPPSVFFDPRLDRLYLPKEDIDPWSREAGAHERGPAAIMRRRWLREHHRQHHRQHYQLQPQQQQQQHTAPSQLSLPPLVPDDGPARPAVPTTTLHQFKKCHRPADVRFLASDLDIQFMPHEPVWSVMQDFPKLEELVFVVPEHMFAYEDLTRELATTAQRMGQEEERWSHAFGEGAVTWKWPVVRLAFRCKGGLKYVELEGTV